MPASTPYTMARSAQVQHSRWFYGLALAEQDRVRSLLDDHAGDETLPPDVQALVDLALESGDAETGEPFLPLTNIAALQHHA